MRPVQRLVVEKENPKHPCEYFGTLYPQASRHFTAHGGRGVDGDARLLLAADLRAASR
jgi:hypothetical protein